MSDITGIIPSKQKLSGYVGTDDQQLTGFIVPRGNKGISPVVTVEQIEGGHTVTFEDIYGKQSFDVMDGAVGPKGEQGIRGEKGEQGDTVVGPQGIPGADGYTPVKGVDYFTPEELAEAAAQAAGLVTPEGIGAAPAFHSHSDYAPVVHSHSEYSTTNHSHSEYAPSGFGYGDEMPWLGFDAVSWTSTDTFQADLEAAFAAMPQGTCKQVQFIDANLSTQKFVGTIWKYTSSYGFLTADNYSGNKAIRTYYGGTWGEWEWENPPMVAGTEYRTAERSASKPVYVKRLDLGALPATGSKNATFSGSAATLVRIEGRAIKSDGTWKPLPFYTSSGDMRAFLDGTKYKVYVTTFSDLSAYSCTVDCYYTKD